jgi:hypothetical protein
MRALIPVVPEPLQIQQLLAVEEAKFLVRCLDNLTFYIKNLLDRLLVASLDF